eukprot:c2345_g1_i1.p1 GENE.c2345_g1_i1~~c2345_g1_i1.p1  ORF type:complete len:249 (-),score=59.21 c2345_g1_i1:63-809(-)
MGEITLQNPAMPKSKREKIVNLTKTQKLGRARKEALVKSIRDCFDEYEHVFVFEFGDLRTQYLKDIRMVWNTSRFFMGRNKVMQIALGKSSAEEFQPALAKLSARLGNQRGLLFTSAKPEDVKKYFDNFQAVDYARAGHNAEISVSLPVGPLSQCSEPSMEPYLRKLGLPTELKNGVVSLRESYDICKEGEPLTVDQAKLLKLFGYPIQQFRLKTICSWNVVAGYTSYVEDTQPLNVDEAEDDEDNDE